MPDHPGKWFAASPRNHVVADCNARVGRAVARPPRQHVLHRTRDSRRRPADPSQSNPATSRTRHS